MGSLLLSTLGTLSSQAYYLFILIVAVGFFGVYVPLNERKKRRTPEKTTKKSPGKEEKPPAALGRSAALKLLAVGVPMAVVGLILLIAAAVMGRPLPTILGAILAGAGLAAMDRAGRELRAVPRRKRPQSPPPEPVDRSRLEQLETLREAGVLDKKEYELEKQKLEEVKK